MGLWSDLINGFTRGFTTGVGGEDMGSNGVCYQERDRIQRLTREVGWSIDDEKNGILYLNFKSPVAKIRQVLISGGDEALVNFSVMSYGEVPARKLPQQVPGYLLERNAEIVLGAWNTHVNEDENALFFCRYLAIGIGLNGGLFKHICETLVQEANDFDLRLQKGGLL